MSSENNKNIKDIKDSRKDLAKLISSLDQKQAKLQDTIIKMSEFDLLLLLRIIDRLILQEETFQGYIGELARYAIGEIVAAHRKNQLEDLQGDKDGEA